jgi:hypothetical protein
MLNDGFKLLMFSGAENCDQISLIAFLSLQYHIDAFAYQPEITVAINWRRDPFRVNVRPQRMEWTFMRLAILWPRKHDRCCSRFRPQGSRLLRNHENSTLRGHRKLYLESVPDCWCTIVWLFNKLRMRKCSVGHFQ